MQASAPSRPANGKMINPGYEIDCAIEEVTFWIDQHDSNDVPARINDHLAVISGDSDFIAEMISELGAGSWMQVAKSL